MEPSQPNNVQKDHEERVNRFDSDIKKGKEQFFPEFEDASDDSRKHRPKHSKSNANQHIISQIEEYPSEKRPFGPFVVNTLQVSHLIRSEGFLAGSVVYNENHNLILGCYMDGSLQFYDATTLLPVEGVSLEKLEGPCTIMSYWPETETYVLGCLFGYVYILNLSSKILQKVQEIPNNIWTMAFINSKLVAFAGQQSQKLYVGNLENGDLLHFDLGDNDAWDLLCLPNKNLLFSSLANGCVQVYRTDQFPRLPMLNCFRGFDSDGDSFWRSIQNVTINGKDYIIIAGGNEKKIRILHLSKGKMKLIKVIPSEDKVYRMVYLENYKILATTHQMHFIRFYSLPSGKLESVLDLGMEMCRSIFLMKDKNCLGVVHFKGDMIKIIQLHDRDVEENEKIIKSTNQRIIYIFMICEQ